MSEIPSRLRPPQGIGAGLKAVQRATVGPEHAEEAARQATMAPEDLERIRRRELDIAQAKEAKVEEIYASAEGGLWKDMPTSLSDLKAWLRTRTETELKELEDKISTESAEQVTEDLAQDDLFGPGSHLYVPVNDTVRRKRIEAQLAPLDLDSYLFECFTDQEVELQPKIKCVFRTLTAEQHVWLEEYWALKDRPGPTDPTTNFTALTYVSVSLRSINGKSPAGSDPYAASTLEAFKKAVSERYNWLVKRPSALTDDLIVNYIWFTTRIRRELLSPSIITKLGNS